MPMLEAIGSERPVVPGYEIRGELGSLFEVVRLRAFRFDPSETEPGRPLGWSCLLCRV